MKVFRSSLFVIIVFVFCMSVFASLAGQGEVTGEVVGSSLSGDHVVFSLNISSQKNEDGPALASPNKFAYAGADKLQVTPGDIIKLRYNSDDSYGIHVDAIEFIQNKPGTVSQGYNTAWLVAPIVVVAAAALLIVALMRRKRVAIASGQ